MQMIIECIKSIFLGIVEGITEWLPISSTGHMILVNEFIGNSGFTSSNLYIYVIQLGAILAVVTRFFHKLNPFAPSKSKQQKKDTWNIWFKVVVSCIPAGVIGLAFSNYMDRFENWYVVATTLIIYGIGFIWIENKKKTATVTDLTEMSYKTALLIGVFQVLSIIPGTSRSGATILGAIIFGCSRAIAAEFTFFLAIPVMFGASFFKIITYSEPISSEEIIVLLLGMAVAYVVSLFSINMLMDYVKKHDFKMFGKYRIILGIVVIAYFSVKMLIFG